MVAAPPLNEASRLLALAEDRSRAGDWRGCEAAARDAVELAPLAAATRHYLGRVLAHLGQTEEAAAQLRYAYSLAPEDAAVRYSLAQVLLQLGRWLEAHEHYEARRALPAFQQTAPRLPFPQWRGESLAGKRLLIWTEPGLADQIQMARFAPYLRDRGADVTLLCHPSLSRLFAALGVRVIPAAGEVQFDDPDYWVTPASIPACLALTPNSVPAAPYLTAPPTPRGGRLGLLWKVDASPERSLPSRPDLPGVSLAAEDIGASDLYETAQIVAGLDLVVTVDAPLAHLAGALGRPVWILLPFLGADPRWLAARRDSPWYPSARIYRQPAPGAWAPVIEEVRRDLQAGGIA